MAKDDSKIYDLVTPVGRLVYPHLHAPDVKSATNKFGDDKWKVTLVIPKEPSNEANKLRLRKLKDAVLEVAGKKWPKRKNTFKTVQHPFRDGDKMAADGKGEHYRGCWVITSKTQFRESLHLLDQQKRPVDEDKVQATFYAGSRCRLVVTAYGYESSEKIRNEDGELEVQTTFGVSFGLNLVQFVRDDAHLGGGGNSAAALDDLDDEELDTDDDLTDTSDDEDDLTDTSDDADDADDLL